MDDVIQQGTGGGMTFHSLSLFFNSGGMSYRSPGSMVVTIDDVCNTASASLIRTCGIRWLPEFLHQLHHSTNDRHHTYLRRHWLSDPGQVFIPDSTVLLMVLSFGDCRFHFSFSCKGIYRWWSVVLLFLSFCMVDAILMGVGTTMCEHFLDLLQSSLGYLCFSDYAH